MRITRDLIDATQAFRAVAKPRLRTCDDCGQLREEGKPHEITGCPQPPKRKPSNHRQSPLNASYQPRLQ